MQILVERFCVRHNGKQYQAGDIIPDVDAAEAKKLVAASHGELRLLQPAAETPHEETVQDDPEPVADDIGLQLPPVEPVRVAKRGTRK